MAGRPAAVRRDPGFSMRWGIYRENTPPTPTLPRAGGGKSLTSQSAEPEEDFH